MCLLLENFCNAHTINPKSIVTVLLYVKAAENANSVLRGLSGNFEITYPL